MIGIIHDLGGDWRHLDTRIEHVTDEIEQLAHGSESCRQLMTVPGIGPLIASAMVAAVANGAAFAKGSDFAAWLGLVPKQMSTGDRTILGRISKRGNRYLRTLFMQGARRSCSDRQIGQGIALDHGLRPRQKGLHHTRASQQAGAYCLDGLGSTAQLRNARRNRGSVRVLSDL
jgi:transposase